MPSTKDLKKRIQSVKNTQQITKAMKMVSAAKLRRSQENIVSLRPYAHELNKLIGELAHNLDMEVSHPVLAKADQPDPQKILILVVTSDRGLCGAFNANVIKTAHRYLRTHTAKFKKLDLCFIGKKGFEFFRNKKSGKYYAEFYNKLDYPKAFGLSQELVDLYLTGEYDEIKLIYTEYKSALVQKVHMESFLPLRRDSSGRPDATAPTIYEPNAQDILDKILPRHFAFQILRVLRESLASEHAARMTAMESATKNAGEMIQKITLVYNKTRQAAITKELLEITAGAEAQKS